MPAAEDAQSIAVRCLEAWTSGDFETARSLLADDVTFTGPLGTTAGGDAYIEGVKGFAKMIKGVDRHRVFGEGEDVCIVYDLVTDGPAGTVPTAGWYRIRDGKVTMVRAFFDARPFEPLLPPTDS
jgi:ketosteroid isomerase-like protein